MKITFLGTGHGFSEKNKFCSSAAVTVGKRHYLIDAGAPIMTLLQNHDMSFWDVGGIFITHTHSDHMFGLIDFTNQMEVFPHFKGVRIPVFVPDAERYMSMTQFLFGKHELHDHRLMYRVYPAEGVIFDDGNLRVTAIPVQHIQNAHAFLLEAEGKRVVFTGDLKAGMPDYPAVITETDVDLVITEAAHTKLNKPEIIELLGKSRTKQLIISHRYDKFNTDAMVAELRDAVADRFPVTCVRDGDVICL